MGSAAVDSRDPCLEYRENLNSKSTREDERQIDYLFNSSFSVSVHAILSYIKMYHFKVGHNCT